MADSFPRNIDLFDQDPRIYYSKVDEKWKLEDDQGDWEFVQDSKTWVPEASTKEQDDILESFGLGGVSTNKRKADDAAVEKVKKAKPVSKKQKVGKLNTGIYVTGLPADVTLEELEERFKKYGVLAQEIDSNKPRIKLYTDEDGNPKGDAFIQYFRPESVKQAIYMEDDYPFRYGEKGVMKVTEADQSYKKVQNTGDEKKPAASFDKQKVIKKTEELNRRLADWSDDEDPQPIPTETYNRWSKVVVMKHMFTLASVENDPKEKQEIAEDVRDECSKIGEVIDVYVFDAEPEGVVSVRFGDPESAKACVQKMNGRFFAGRRVEVYIADGSEHFERKDRRFDDEDDAEEQKRLDRVMDSLKAKDK